MPVIEVIAPTAHPPEGLLDAVCARTAACLGIPAGNAWAIWEYVPPRHYTRSEWRAGSLAPMVFIRCKATHAPDRLRDVLRSVRDLLSATVPCEPDEIYIAVDRIAPRELMVAGEIWDGD